MTMMMRIQYTGPEPIPVTRQLVREAINLTVSCHYCSSALQLPSQLPSITANWPMPNCTAWWQRHVCVC